MIINKEHKGQDLGRITLDSLDNPAYRAVYDALKDELVVGEEVPDGIAVSLLRSTIREITEDSFTLREIDRRPVSGVNAPGKSAHISFTQSAEVYSRVAMGQPPRTEHALVDARVEELRSVGFFTLYTPILPHDPLHVRIVHALHRQNPDSLLDIPEYGREALARIFNHELQRNK